MKSSHRQLNSLGFAALRLNSMSAYSDSFALLGHNRVWRASKQSKANETFHLTQKNKAISNKQNNVQKFVAFIFCGLYIQLVSKMLSGNGIQLVSGQSIKCGDMKQCSAMFRQATLQHNLSYDLSKERIEEMCIKLKKAVNCFNEFRKSCVNEHYHHSKMTASFYDQMSEGPLGLTMELCNNEKFKHDYLTLGPCQKKYRGEFDRCLRLPQVNTKTNNRSGNGNGHHNETILERFIEHCCTLHTYHNCIYDISQEKCGKDAAEFSLKILELFNRAYLRDCAKHANLPNLCVRNHYLASSASTVSSFFGCKINVSSLFCSFLIATLLWMVSTNNISRSGIIWSFVSSFEGLQFPLLLFFFSVPLLSCAGLSLSYLLCASQLIGKTTLSSF